mgnify:FL=1
MPSPATKYVVLTLFFALGACFQGTGGEWFKPGVESGATARELSACQSGARMVGAEEAKIDQDIAASRGSDWQKTGSYSANTQQMAQSAATRQAEMVGRCMRNKGFTQPAAK